MRNWRWIAFKTFRVHHDERASKKKKKTSCYCAIVDVSFARFFITLMPEFTKRFESTCTQQQRIRAWAVATANVTGRFFLYLFFYYYLVAMYFFRSTWYQTKNSNINNMFLFKRSARSYYFIWCLYIHLKNLDIKN